MVARPPACKRAARVMSPHDLPPIVVRDARLDTVRGTLLVIMTIDHLAPQWITRYSSESLGFVSAMEGFFVLFGVAYARTYRRLLQTPARAWSKSLRRALTVYGYHLATLALAFALACAGWLVGPAWLARAADVQQFGPGLALWAVTLIYRPQFFDVLPAYVLLLLPAPVLLRWLCRPGASAWVLLGSAAGWLLGQWFNPWEQLARAVSPIQWVWPNLLTWQAPFVIGLFCATRETAGPLLKAVNSRAVRLLCLAIVGVCFALKHELISLSPSLLLMFDKGNLGPARLLNLVALVLLAGWLMGRFAPASKVTWLAFLGRHSLEVFSFHIPLSYALMPLFAESLAKPVTLGLLAAAPAALSLPAWLHAVYQRRGRAA